MYRCPECIAKWGAEPSMWGDSPEELEAYFEHEREHRTSYLYVDIDHWEDEGGRYE